MGIFKGCTDEEWCAGGCCSEGNQATFTWENAKFSRKVTDQAGINIRKAIICCKIIMPEEL